MTESTILVVEDNPITRRMFRVALESQGWRVLEAGDARTALEWIDRGWPDAIVTDLTLPDMDGLELQRLVMARPGSETVPVIATSGFLSKLEQSRSLELGFVEHLFKPVDPFRLIEAVRSVLAVRSSSNALERPSILLVDDDPMQARLVKMQLERAGFEVRTALSGMEGLRLARERRPEAVVSDVLMPGMDGFRFCLAFRREPGLEDVPVVLISVLFAGEGDRRLALSVGASDLVARTPANETLIEALHRAIEAARPPAPAADFEISTEDYAARMMHQLERQLSVNAELAGKLALHEAAMGVLARIRETARSRAPLEAVLPDLLEHALDAAGVSMGCIFLVEADGSMRLRSHVGMAAADPATHELPGFVAYLRRAMDSMDSIEIPEAPAESQSETELLTRLGARSMLLIRLGLGSDPMGVLVLAAARRRLGGDWLPFAEAIGVQISQAVALAGAVARISQEQEKFHQMAENIHEVFWIVSPGNERVEYINPAYETVWGRSRKSLEEDPRSWLESVHPDDRDRVRDNAMGHLEHRNLDQTYRILHPDGTVRWIRDRSALLFDDAGKAFAIAGVAADVTDLKQAAEEIRLIHSITDAINGAGSVTEALSIVLHEVCRVTGWRFGQAWVPVAGSERLEMSPACAGELTGMEDFRAHSREISFFRTTGLVGRTFTRRERTWSRDLEHDENFLRRTRALEAGLRAGVWVPVLAGEEVIAILEFFMTTAREGDSRLIDLVATIGQQLGTDLRRKAAEESARARAELAELTAEIGLALTSARTFSEAMNRCTDSLVRRIGASLARIWMIDPPGSTLLLQASSGLYTNLDGPHRVVPVGQDKIGRIAAEKKPHFSNDVPADPWVSDPAWARCEDLVAFAGHPLIVDDKLVGVMALFSRQPFGDLVIDSLRSISDMVALAIQRELVDRERASTQSQLQQSQKMEAVGQLAGGVAHDFNNLLSVILGYSELCLDDLRPDDPLAEQIGIIRDAGQKAASLTRRLLAFSRKQVLDPRPVDLNAVVRDLEKMLRRLIGEDIDLLSVLAARPDPILADPGQLEQVIMNLVVNARDAMPSGGCLTLETREVVVDDSFPRRPVDLRTGAYIQLAVTDTGCGMDAATMTHIFEPFFTTKPKDKGTGLGLSTVYGIVKQSGGHVTVYSEVGIGTTFRVYLPRTETPSSVPADEPATGPTGRGTETILLVEDEAAVRALAHRVLVRCGYTVLEASNGGEALLLCESHNGRLDLLLSDVVMPMMSGIDLVERLKALRPGLKVLFMSGYTEKSLNRNGVLDPGIAFIAKPFSPRALERRVREVLDQARNGAPG